MSIPKSFKYCPKCSASALKPRSTKSVVCTECGFKFYFNPAAAVAGLIFNDLGELLVTVRAHDPCKGKLDLPGGFIDFAETAEHALAREIKEELNLQIESMEYFASAPNEYTYKGILYPTLDMAFICTVSHFSSLKLQEEIHEIRMLQPTQIDLKQIAFESIRNFISSYING